MIELTNTLTSKKELFESTNSKKVNVFVCGPTVYDYVHIGNARTFVFFDVVAKYLKHKGYDVDYVQNITDIDDKIINRAKKENKSWEEIADFYFEKFKEDMEALGVTSPRYARATDYIEEVKKQVKTLASKGNVYLIGSDLDAPDGAGGWYFDLKTFPEYGKLSGRTAEMADDAISRIDESEKKRNKGDFCVWKLADRSETGYWDDKDLGYGRPGWHIEDTAITEKEFGPQYDLHGGGQDLIFPHHEAEIAQQESASGKVPFVKYWMHVGFVVNKETKMSKSLENFETANELLKKYPKEVLRFYLLSNHYRSPLDFSDKILGQSEAGVRRIYEFNQKLNLAEGNGKESFEKQVEQAGEEFVKAMGDDFNTPQAFAVIFDLIRELNTALIANTLDKKNIEKIKEFIKEVDSILGVVPSKQEKIPEEMTKLIEQREKHRQNKNFAESDKIRTQIEDLGWSIEDTIYGPLIVKK